MHTEGIQGITTRFIILEDFSEWVVEVTGGGQTLLGRKVESKGNPKSEIRTWGWCLSDRTIGTDTIPQEFRDAIPEFVVSRKPPRNYGIGDLPVFPPLPSHWLPSQTSD